MTAAELTEERINLLVHLIRSISQQTMVIPLEDARALLEQHGVEEAVFPFFDPTQYREIGPLIRWHGPYLRAFLAYREALEAIKDEFLPQELERRG